MGKKIIIIGNGGTGKSTLSTKLSAMLDIPVHHLDLLTFTDDGKPVGESAFRERLNTLFANESWIIEGWSYQSTLSDRIAAADTIIYLEYPIWFSYWNAFKRSLYSLVRPDKYSPIKPLWEYSKQIAKAMWLVHKIYEPQARTLLSNITGKYYYHCTTRRDLNRNFKQWEALAKT
jgi:adenylate kinase family enzyme